MKNCCRCLWIFGAVYTLCIWGFSTYYFHTKVREMEELFDLANMAKQTGKNHTGHLRRAAELVARGFYRNNWEAATVCLGTGSEYLNIHQYDRAAFWLHMDEKLNNKEPSQFMEIHTYENLAYFYHQIKHFEQADFYMEKADSLIYEYIKGGYYRRGVLSDDILRFFYNLYGAIKLDRKQFQTALSHFENAQRYFTDSASQQAQSHYFKSRCFLGMEKYEKALEELKTASGFLAENTPEKIAINIYFTYCEIFIKTNEHDQAKAFLQLAGSLEEKMNFSDSIQYEQFKNILSKENKYVEKYRSLKSRVQLFYKLLREKA